MSRLKFLVATGLVLVLGFATLDDARADSAWKEAGVGVAAVLGSSIYTPAKVTYAAIGAVAGGVAWLVTGGRTEVAQKIWDPAVGGDYLITPQVLQGPVLLDSTEK